MAIYTSITDLIGGTPLLELKNYEAENKLEAKIVAKLEYFNPAGSVKDRIAKAMIDDAEASGALKPGLRLLSPPAVTPVLVWHLLLQPVVTKLS